MKKSILIPSRIYTLRLTLFALLTIALIALIVTAATAVYFFNQQHTLSSRFYSLKVLAQDIALHDEILTMSTLVASLDGARKWRQRYDQYEASLDKLLQQASETDPKIARFFNETAEANRQLVMLEKRSFELVRSNKREEALALLNSDEYQAYKVDFSTGIANAIGEVLKDTQSSLDSSREQRGKYLVLSMVISFLLVMFLWYFLIRYVRLTDMAIAGIARTDELSGLLNRREFDRILTHEINRSRREDKLLMLMVLDLDNFKKFNDRYGHPKGDEVIRKIGKLLAHFSRRANESAFRVGGEEFVFLTTCLDREQGVDLAGSICREVLRLDIPHEENPPLGKVTASCGIAFTDQLADSTASEMYSRADQALYQAKRDGKNQFVIFKDSAASPIT